MTSNSAARHACDCSRLWPCGQAVHPRPWKMHGATRRLCKGGRHLCSIGCDGCTMLCDGTRERHVCCGAPPGQWSRRGCLVARLCCTPGVCPLDEDGLDLQPVSTASACRVMSSWR